MSATSDKDSQNSVPAFLETHPPYWAARGLATLLVLMFTALMIASMVVRVPETVSGKFVLMPVQGTNPVRSSYDGTITEVHVAEGQQVRKGDLLFLLQAQMIGDRSSELGGLLTEVRSGEKQLHAVKSRYESQRLADQQEDARLNGRISYLQRMIELKEKERSLTNELASSHAELYKSGITNKAEYANQQLQAGRIEIELQQMQTEQQEAQTALKRLQHESRARWADYQIIEQELRQKMESRSIRTGALQKELIQSRGDEMSITASCSGVVLRLEAKSSGAVVQEGETLLELVCSDQELQARLTIPQTGVSRIRKGQVVKLLYDAFPYQRHGVRLGNIRWISPAATVVDGKPVFEVRAEIEDRSILLHGQQRNLMAGMEGQARVVVEPRTLISYAFEPIRGLKEEMQLPNSTSNENHR
jgi:multidrug efflux pump subunit AcrA (membrane-fusion protein)